VWTLTSCPADLVVLYQPALDEIAHQLLHHALSDWPQRLIWNAPVPCSSVTAGWSSILHNIVAVASHHQRMRRHCRTSNTVCKRPCVCRTGKHCVCNAGVTSGQAQCQHQGTLLSGPQRPLSSDPTSFVHSMVPQKSGDTTRRPYNRPRICRHSSPAVDRV
jgi:hypothetical protein